VNTNTPGRFFFAVLLFVGLVACASAADSKSSMVPLGDNTFRITRKATSGFNRDVDALKAEAQDDAEKYCASLGKKIKIVSLTADKPLIAMGYVKAMIVFKALDAQDPEITGVTTPAPAPPERLSPTGDMYNDLLKLDDLRKRGILTEEEFQSEKKKVLARSQ
jgi:hypothetical protein